jgi:hypothetical protein
MEHMVGSFNLDMVGMGATLGASGALNFPSIWEVIKREQEEDVLKLIEPSVGGPGGSDHTGFIRKGIETIFLMSRGGVGHQDYHQPEDDIEKIEPEMLRLAGQFTLRGMMNLANEAKVNLLIPRRQDRYNALRMRIANLNPELKESAWTVVDLKADSGDALYQQIYDSLRTMIKKSPSSDSEASRTGSQSAGRPPSKSITRGLANVEIIGTDTRLLDLVIDVHGIGRVDLKADHPLWVEKGQLTEDGETMLGALEERGVVLRLLSPGQQLMKDVLYAASKPFVITGEYEIPEELIDRLTSRGVLYGVDFDPREVTGFITRVEQLKSRLGDRKNLFAYLTGLEGLDDAKTPLYLGLVDRGWAHREIVGEREHRGLVGGASLGSLGKPSSE